MEVKEYLERILESIRAIATYKKGNYLLQIDRKTRKAVERELEIIGQSMVDILKINPEIKISHKEEIIKLRKKLIYSYNEIDFDLIFKYTTRDILSLEGEIVWLLKKYQLDEKNV